MEFFEEWYAEFELTCSFYDVSPSDLKLVALEIRFMRGKSVDDVMREAWPNLNFK